MSDSIYLDYNATTPVCIEAKRAVMSALDIFANPSAVYRSAKAAKALLDESRIAVAALINARSEQIFFTSGGTEANNWVINAVLQNLSARAPIVSSAIEHDAVLSALSELCATNQRLLSVVAPCENGIVDAHRLVQATTSNSCSDAKGFITLMLANNETGAIQPVAEVGHMLGGSGHFFHVDAVQAVGKIPIDVQAIGCNSLSLSAHKFFGPKGVGALYIRDPKRFLPWIIGGGQEGGLRSGTENLPGIAGMGAAASNTLANLSKRTQQLQQLRSRLLHRLDESGLDYTVNSPDAEHSLPNTLSLAFAGIRAEALAAYLSLRYNIEVSVGSACGNNKRRRQSHVLNAMGMNQERIDGTLRVSLGWPTRVCDVDLFVSSLSDAIQHVSCISSVPKADCQVG